MARYPQKAFFFSFVSLFSSAQRASKTDYRRHVSANLAFASRDLIETLPLNATTCLLTEYCQQNISAPDGMLCCTCFCLQCWCTIKQVMHRLGGYAPQSSPPLLKSTKIRLLL